MTLHYYIDSVSSACLKFCVLCDDWCSHQYFPSFSTFFLFFSYLVMSKLFATQQAGEGQGFREARRASSGILKIKHFPQTGPCLMEGCSPAKPETAPAASGEGWDASVQSPSQLIPLSSPTWVLTLQDPLPLARGMRPCPVDAS